MFIPTSGSLQPGSLLAILNIIPVINKSAYFTGPNIHASSESTLHMASDSPTAYRLRPRLSTTLRYTVASVPVPHANFSSDDPDWSAPSKSDIDLATARLEAGGDDWDFDPTQQVHVDRVASVKIAAKKPHVDGIPGASFRYVETEKFESILQQVSCTADTKLDGADPGTAHYGSVAIEADEIPRLDFLRWKHDDSPHSANLPNQDRQPFRGAQRRPALDALSVAQKKHHQPIERTLESDETVQHTETDVQVQLRFKDPMQVAIAHAYWKDDSWEGGLRFVLPKKGALGCFGSMRSNAEEDDIFVDDDSGIIEDDEYETNVLNEEWVMIRAQEIVYNKPNTHSVTISGEIVPLPKISSGHSQQLARPDPSASSSTHGLSNPTLPVKISQAHYQMSSFHYDAEQEQARLSRRDA